MPLVRTRHHPLIQVGVNCGVAEPRLDWVATSIALAHRRRMTWLIESKIEVPRVDSALLHRGRLLARLMDTGERRPITVVSAPTGYGKTTLLAQWSRAMDAGGVRAIWYTLDEDDTNPATFLAYLATALNRIGIGGGAMHEALCSGAIDVPPRRVMALLIDAVARSPHEVAIVLDDCHRLEGPAPEATSALIQMMVDRLPGRTRLVFSGRTRPRLRLATLRASDRVEHLALDDLKFTIEESERFLGASLAPADIEAVHQQVEGWPIGIHLARRHLGACGSLPANGTAVRLMREECTDVFAENVVADLPPETREILLKTSILERLSGPLIERVTGCRDGCAVLRELAASELFLCQIDSEGEWFRFHALFAQYLRAQLHAQFPEWLPNLHRLASQWFAAHEFLSEATAHAMASGGDEFLKEILLRAGGWRLLLRDGAPHFRVFRELPPAVARSAPSLQLAQIYVMIRDGKLTQARTALDECYENLERLTPHESSVGRCRALTLEFLLRAVRGQSIESDEIEAIETIAWSAARGDDDLMISVGNTLAWEWLLAGDFARCVANAEPTIERCLRRRTPFLEKFARVAGTVAHIELGQMQRALDTLRRNRGENRHDVISQVLEAEITSERGDVAAARARIVPLLSEIGDEQWFDFSMFAFRAAFAVASDEEGIDLSSRCQDIARRLDQPRLEIFACLAKIHRAILGRRRHELRVEHTEALFRPLPLNARDWRIEVPRRLVLAEYALLIGRPEDAAVESRRLCAWLEQRRHVRYLLRALVVQALAEWAKGARGSAMELFERLLALVAETGITLPLLERSSCLEPLLAAAMEAPAGFTPERIALLDMLRAQSKPQGGTAMSARLPGVENLLSPRENEILRGLAAGDTSKETALRLGISINTVMFHRKNLYRKLNCFTRSQALAAARVRGLLGQTGSP